MQHLYHVNCPKCKHQEHIDAMLVVAQVRDKAYGSNEPLWREAYTHTCVACGEPFDSKIRVTVDDHVYNIATLKSIRDEGRSVNEALDL